MNGSYPASNLENCRIGPGNVPPIIRRVNVRQVSADGLLSGKDRSVGGAGCSRRRGGSIDFGSSPH